MMDKHLSRLNNLFEIAKYHNSGIRPKIVSALYVKNKLVCYGFNSVKKSHTFQKRYAPNVHAIWWHAETKVCYNAFKNQVDTSGASLYVSRARQIEDSSSNLVWCFGNARPCHGCMTCIEDFRIKKVFYTLDVGPSKNLEYGVLTM